MLYHYGFTCFVFCSTKISSIREILLFGLLFSIIVSKYLWQSWDITNNQTKEFSHSHWNMPINIALTMDKAIHVYYCNIPCNTTNVIQRCTILRLIFTCLNHYFYWHSSAKIFLDTKSSSQCYRGMLKTFLSNSLLSSGLDWYFLLIS